MIPMIGLAVCTYAIARLIQVPIEHSTIRWKLPVLIVVSAVAAIGVGLIALALIVQGVSFPVPER